MYIYSTPKNIMLHIMYNDIFGVLKSMQFNCFANCCSSEYTKVNGFYVALCYLKGVFT